MRVLQFIFLTVGLTCLGIYGFNIMEARGQQAALERELEEELRAPLPAPPKNSKAPAPLPLPRKKLSEGDLVGRLEIPRLRLSVMVMEGTGNRTLRLGAGHIPDTSYPGVP